MAGPLDELADPIDETDQTFRALSASRGMTGTMLDEPPTSDVAPLSPDEQLSQRANLIFQRLPNQNRRDARQSELELQGIRYQQRESDRQTRQAERQQAQASSQERIQNRLKAQDLADRGIPTFRDASGGVTPVTEPDTGAPLLHYDPKNEIAYDSQGNPKSISYESESGPPVLRDPFENIAPTTDEKTGDIYKKRPGLPWQWQGVDPDVQAQRMQIEKDKALAKESALLGRKLTLDHADLVTGDAEHKQMTKELQQTVPELQDPKYQGADRDTVLGAINDHFDTEYASPEANATNGWFSNDLSPTAQRVRVSIDQRKADAMQTASDLYDLKDRQMDLGDKVAAGRQQVGAELDTLIAHGRGQPGPLDQAPADQVANPDTLKQALQSGELPPDVAPATIAAAHDAQDAKEKADALQTTNPGLADQFRALYASFANGIANAVRETVKGAINVNDILTTHGAVLLTGQSKFNPELTDKLANVSGDAAHSLILGSIRSNPGNLIASALTGRDITKLDDRLKDTIGAKVGNFVGSAVPFVATNLLAPEVGVPVTVGTLFSAGYQNTYENAKAAGVSDDKAAGLGLLSGSINGVLALPFGSAGKAIGEALGITKVAPKLIADALEKAFTNGIVVNGEKQVGREAVRTMLGHIQDSVENQVIPQVVKGEVREGIGRILNELYQTTAQRALTTLKAAPVPAAIGGSVQTAQNIVQQQYDPEHGTFAGVPETALAFGALGTVSKGFEPIARARPATVTLDSIARGGGGLAGPSVPPPVPPTTPPEGGPNVPTEPTQPGAIPPAAPTIEPARGGGPPSEPVGPNAPAAEAPTAPVAAPGAEPTAPGARPTEAPFLPTPAAEGAEPGPVSGAVEEPIHKVEHGEYSKPGYTAVSGPEGAPPAEAPPFQAAGSIADAEARLWRITKDTNPQLLNSIRKQYGEHDNFLDVLNRNLEEQSARTGRTGLKEGAALPQVPESVTRIERSPLAQREIAEAESRLWAATRDNRPELLNTLRKAHYGDENYLDTLNSSIAEAIERNRLAPAPKEEQVPTGEQPTAEPPPAAPVAEKPESGYEGMAIKSVGKQPGIAYEPDLSKPEVVKRQLNDLLESNSDRLESSGTKVTVGAHEGESGFLTNPQSGDVSLDPDKIAGHAPIIKDAGGNPRAWLASGVGEEHIHSLQIRAAGDDFEPTYTAIYNQLDEPTKKALSEVYPDPAAQTPASLGAEYERMVLQHRAGQTITEAHHRDISPILPALAGAQSAALEANIERVRRGIEAAAPAPETEKKPTAVAAEAPTRPAKEYYTAEDIGAGITKERLDDSYSADKISQTGTVRRPVKIADRLWVSTGGSGRGDQISHSLVELVPAEDFAGKTTTYHDKVVANPQDPIGEHGWRQTGDTARNDPNGFYYGCGRGIPQKLRFRTPRQLQRCYRVSEYPSV
jgi:hypothetical protein